MTNVPKHKPNREELKPDEVLCDYCSAKCCHYFALPIETPTSPKEFEYLRWYIMHGKATVFTEDDDWYLLVHNACDHLQSDNRCGIYETRPQICRDYSTKDCEYEDNWTYDHYFEVDEQVQEYNDAIFSGKGGQGIRTEPPALLPLLS